MTAPTFAERLAALPPHTPGRIERIPLDLYPAYMAREHLIPNGTSAIGNLYVKRDAPAETTETALAKYEPLTMDYVLSLFEEAPNES